MAAAKTPENEIRSRMKKLGIYKKEFDVTIQRYCELKNQYDTLNQRYIDSGYECTVPTAAGEKKSPLVTTLESLRRDILAIETALGLTPQGLLKLQESAFEIPKKPSKGSAWKCGFNGK